MECEACGGKMSASSVVCPHCGARRAKPPKLELDHDEMRALLVADGVAGGEEDRDWLSTLVLPHPSTYGAARALELLLTVIALPFVIAGVLTFALHRLRGGGRRMTMTGELGPLLLMSLMGGVGMWGVLSIAGVSTGRAFEIVIGFIVALSIRAWIRARSMRR